MPFNVALSGIRAANSDLRVTGNNIANASTTGFKQSRTDFGDIYSSSAFSGLNQAGSGVRVQSIAQQFTQGNISFTENALDLSVSGSGFFVTSFGGDQSFTRAGTFGLDQQGFIVNNNDARLQGFDADSSGNISGLIDDIQIQTTNIQPTATTGVDIALNVDSREAVIQTSGTRYVSSGGVARADINGYAAQSLDFTNPDGTTVTFNSLASDNTFDTVSTLNSLSGVTATSESSATLSTWSNGLNVTINGAAITNTGINQTSATEITDLPGLTATYDAGAGTISVVSTIGDLVFGATGSGGADQFLSVTGTSGLPQTLEFDGAGDLVTTGNLGVSGISAAGTVVAVVPLTLSSSNTFKGNFTGDTVEGSSSGNFTAAAAAGTLIADLTTAGATDYDFSITVDGTPSAADISLPPGTYADEDAVAVELQTQIDADVSLNGLGITVAYDTDHFVFTSSNTTGSGSTVSVTAVNVGAGLGITGGTAAPGTDSLAAPLVQSSSGNFTASASANTLIADLASASSSVPGTSGNFTAAAAAGTLISDLTTAGATDYDFSITVDGTPSAADISLPPGTYADEDAVAVELQTQIDADVNLNGLGVTVVYDTDHFVFTSSFTTGTASTVDVTAVGGSAGTGLGITGGTPTAGTDSVAGDYDFSITVDGTPSAADISVPPATYADEDAVAVELQAQIDADASLNGLGITVAYDTDHFVFTSPSTTGSTSTVAVTAVGGSAGTGLGITVGTATAGTDADAYDFSIVIDGVASAADISLPVANYADYDAMATALQVAVNADVNLSGVPVTVTYDTDHFVFTSPSDTGVASTVAITAVGANAGAGLGITGGAATAGTDTGIYDFSITVDGVNSTTDIRLPIADYASYDDLATALETAINADTSIADVSVVFDTDHFVFTSGTTGTTSTVALTAVGASVADLGIGAGTATAGVTDITVGGVITLALDEGYTLTDNSVTPIFDNASVSFVNNGFDPTSPDTYNHSTSVTLYDSLGNAHVMQQYFIKQPYDPANSATFANHWEMAVQIDGENVGDPVISAPTTPTVATFDVFFTPNGTLDPALSDSLLISNWTPIDADGIAVGALGPLNVAGGGSTPVADPAINSNFEINMDNSTQVGSDFEVRTLDQNGSTTGRLVGIDVDDSGIIFARYTNGENQVLAQVALADFANSQGLQADGDSSWVQTFKSGEPIIGGPGTASLGLIQSGALEDSNVDLSEQLVNLIIAQRNFQANAKTIETADTITQTIINLR